MIKNIMPRVAMLNSPLTESPQTGPYVTMDDTAYTMDDSRVLLGGPVVIATSIKVGVVSPLPALIIKKRR